MSFLLFFVKGKELYKAYIVLSYILCRFLTHIAEVTGILAGHTVAVLMSCGITQDEAILGAMFHHPVVYLGILNIQVIVLVIVTVENAFIGNAEAQACVVVTAA